MATRRRGGGEGGIRREERTRTTKDGQTVTVTYWQATVELDRDPATGRRRRVWVRAKTKAEAMAKIAAARKQIDSGVRDEPGLTVGRFLTDWVELVLKPRVGASTVANYAQAIRLHIIPGLGRYKLRDLTPEQVDRLLRAKADAGLSKRYVGRIRSILADALSHAERRQLVSRNAGRLSIMPSCEPTPEPRALTAAEASAFVTAALASGSDGAPERRLGVMLALMVAIGLRPGEATGLVWEDFDASAGTLTVSGSMKRTPSAGGRGYDLVRGSVKKSSAGERTIQLPPALVTMLGAHRRRQAAERLAAGPLWVDQGLIFASEAGTPLDPSNVRRAVTATARAAGLEGSVNPYTARHSAASLRLDAGQPLDQVADLLGDDPRTVLLHYRHRVHPVVAVGADVPIPLPAQSTPRH
jgi:integrase